MFHSAHRIIFPNFARTCERLRNNQWRKYIDLASEQEKDLQTIVRYSFDNVPYYRRTFKGLGLQPENIKSIQDLDKIPILTKKDIKRNWDELKPIGLDSIRYEYRSTGGTTGTPLRYRVANEDRALATALLYRGWGYAGYEPGDRMVFLAGASLGLDTKSRSRLVANQITRNALMLSSFDMSEHNLSQYTDVINKAKPRFIRGYPSALFFFADWLEKRRRSIHKPDAIFATAEKMLPEFRHKIELMFGCPVLDHYGLNDGGLSAFECPAQHGLHIDTERSILEVVDGRGHQKQTGSGRIIATSLHNLAMPLLRYETGDEGEAAAEVCGCGRGHKLLKTIEGRSVDMLVTPDGRFVHGWFFLYIFWKFFEGIREYQVIQHDLRRLTILIVPDDDFRTIPKKEIQNVVRLRSPDWQLDFKIVDSIDRTKAGKFKFVVREFDL